MAGGRLGARPALPRLFTTRAGAEGQLALFLVLLALLAGFIVYPLVRVLAVAVSSPEGFTLAPFSAFFARPLFIESLVNTLAGGIAAVAFGSLIALPLAVLVARYDFPGRALIQTLAVLPLVIPPFVGAVAFQQILGRSGIVNLFLLDTMGFGIPCNGAR